MYLRHTTHTKNGKTLVYWRLVRSVRHGRKVVQETVAQLGEMDAEGRARCCLSQYFVIHRHDCAGVFHRKELCRGEVMRLSGGAGFSA